MITDAESFDASLSAPGTSGPCTGYGPHPEAHAAISAFADRMAEIFTASNGADPVELVGEALKPVLAVKDLLAPCLRTPDEDWYCKHILYACPEKHFTLLALVWLPGQGTVIHGHTAWGAVGVYEGCPNVAVYDCREIEDGRHEATEIKDIRCKPGDVALVRPGLKDVHRIYNATDETMITLHAYGLDLVEDPDAINLVPNL